MLQVDSVAKVWCHVGCRCALKGTVKCIGAAVRIAESRYWGYKCAGKGLAIVAVDEIFISNVKPEFSFVSKASPSDSWDKEATVGSLFQQRAELNTELELMVQTFHLYILVSPNHVSGNNSFDSQ